MATASAPPRLPGTLNMPVTLDEQSHRFGPRLANMPAALFQAIPTGFGWLDETCGGGLIAQDLILIAGKQNVGKTTIALQIARNIAAWAHTNEFPLAPMLVSYEHDSWDMYSRLLCMESFIQDPKKPLSYWEISEAIRRVKQTHHTTSGKPFIDLLFSELPPQAARALHEVSKYSGHLLLEYGNRAFTAVDVIETIMDFYRTERKLHIIPILDYLQTIPPPIALAEHAISAPDVVNMVNINKLKDLAVSFNVPIIAVAAVDAEALKKQRPVHLEDIFGPIQSQYAIDRGLIINPDVVLAENGADSIRLSKVRLALEKNRKGPSELEYSHVRHGHAFFIEPDGEEVALEESFQQDRARIQRSQVEQEA